MDAIDELLIAKTRQGSTECFDVLMQRYERDVYRVAAGFGTTRDNALDICQNVFLKVYRALPSFAGRSSFKTWLLRIAYNEGVNWVRSRQRSRASQQVGLETVSLPAPGDQEERLIGEEQRQQLARSLQALNQRSRLAVTLRYFQELPIGEIANILDCSEGVVRNMLFRSVRKLQQAVAAE